MTNDFDKYGYVHIKDFLHEQNCRDLTNILHQLVNEGKTNSDSQCPLSQSIYGNETFDKLLIDLLPHFEKHCGKSLIPTYSYARLYKPGEELKKHTDRPACEISATVTLGFDGNVWSIYMAGNKVDMQVGDAVLYRGMDIEHWREPYTEGQWQAQVFLHYVDANGPYKNEQFDKRSTLGLPKDNQNYPIEYWVFEKVLNDDIINSILNEAKLHKTKQQTIGTELESNTDLNIRNAQGVTLSPNLGIGALLTGMALNANNQAWKFDVKYSNQSEYLRYDKEGHYVSHIDTTFLLQAQEHRKLTTLAFLNDDFEGGKFYIQIGPEKQYPPQQKGTVLVFPSYMVHGVEPVTKGVRYSCVTWLVGPYFK